MKKLVVLILVVFSLGVKAQTVIPATTTVDSLSKMANGSYRFYTGAKKDTVDMSKDTVPKCPVCPPQRTVVSFCWDAINKRTVFTYQDGSKSTL